VTAKAGYGSLKTFEPKISSNLNRTKGYPPHPFVKSGLGHLPINGGIFI
jgi:hypothetical protein